MADSFVQITPDSNGKRIDNTELVRGGNLIYRQRVEVYPSNEVLLVDNGLDQGLTNTELRANPVEVKVGSGDITQDAWGIQKMSIPHSVFHGLWTFDVPPTQWFMYENGVQVYSSTNIISENSAGTLRTTEAKHTLLMESRATPRYQPNRGHLYSTALWCPDKTNDGIREWGLATVENGVFFRLKADGLLYAVLKSGGVETKEQLIDTSVVPGFDVQKNNTYDIQYQWRGAGDYWFYINLVHVHTFDILGTLTSLSMEDPALPAIMKAVRTTQDVEIKAGCVDIASENGNDDRLQYASVYADVSLNGTNIPLVTVYNPLTINGKTNTRMSELSRITLTCDKKATFKVWATRDPAAIIGATLVAINSGSFLQTDSPDTVTGAVKATSVNTALMKLITVIPVQAGVSKTTIIHSRIELISQLLEVIIWLLLQMYLQEHVMQ
jgi:hypothetical protein